MLVVKHTGASFWQSCSGSRFEDLRALQSWYKENVFGYTIYITQIDPRYRKIQSALITVLRKIRDWSNLRVYYRKVTNYLKRNKKRYVESWKRGSWEEGWMPFSIVLIFSLEALGVKSFEAVWHPCSIKQACSSFSLIKKKIPALPPGRYEVQGLSFSNDTTCNVSWYFESQEDSKRYFTPFRTSWWMVFPAWDKYQLWFH